MKPQTMLRHARVWNVLEGMPGMAEKLYRGIDDINALGERYHSFMSRTGGDSLLEQSLGTACNYSSFDILMRQGNVEGATNIAHTLASADMPIQLLDVFLRYMGTSYERECCEKRELLPPSKVDELVFDRFVPGQQHLTTEYLGRSGIVVVHRLEENHHHRSFYTCDESPNEVPGTQMIEGASGRYSIGDEFECYNSETREEVEVDAQMKSKGRKDTAPIIFTDNKYAQQYLLARWHIMTVGKVLEDELLSLDMPGHQFNVRVSPIKS